MIDEDMTWQFYGYHSSSLSHSSHKSVVAVCEECYKPRALKFRDYKDLCVDCARYLSGKLQSGRLASDEARANMRKASRRISGSDHCCWKGGATPRIKAVRNSSLYKNWRSAVFERDDYTCQMCNERGGRLEAHHIHPFKDHKNDLMIFDINNGVTLCKKCHRSIRGKEYDYIEQFEA